MKILEKMVIVLIVAVCVMGIIPQTKVCAAGSSVSQTMQDIKGDTESGGAGIADLKGVINGILGFIQVASGILSIVMIAWTGFRYIIETPEMKTELKKNMIPIVVGVILVFGATSIARFIVGLIEK